MTLEQRRETQDLLSGLKNLAYEEWTTNDLRDFSSWHINVETSMAPIPIIGSLQGAAPRDARKAVKSGTPPQGLLQDILDQKTFIDIPYESKSNKLEGDVRGINAALRAYWYLFQYRARKKQRPRAELLYTALRALQKVDIQERKTKYPQLELALQNAVTDITAGGHIQKGDDSPDSSPAKSTRPAKRAKVGRGLSTISMKLPRKLNPQHVGVDQILEKIDTFDQKKLVRYDKQLTRAIKKNPGYAPLKTLKERTSSLLKQRIVKERRGIKSRFRKLFD